MNAERPGYGALGSRDIAQLLAVADHGSIRRAADALGMTQPGLSKNIRLIEDRLGMVVFERSTTGAVATEIGTLLLRRGRQILLDLEAIHRDLRDELLSETGRVRIGAGPVAAPIIASQVIARCARDHPGIAIEMDVGTPSEQFPRLVRGDIDMFIGNCDAISLPANIQARVIDEVEPVFFVRKGHPLALQPRVELRDLRPWKIAHVRLTAPFAAWYGSAAGVGELHTGFQCDDFEMLAEAVETSDMVSYASPQILARLQKRYAIATLDIPGIDFRHHIHCAQPAGRALSRPGQKVAQLIEAAFAAAAAR
ncbi:LysR family transcriptional regulator [Polymorphobacter arshaanensis]|uniref:LysR family transcriptional regulator n=1 Tax=Glacieibacterium arshaanense TaxID=2511025 RepID=A0A4Y9EMU5_9SPHN|nr:LysR family transcriptional regulator [Polymorphobacter arshaanensis]TFU03357.1 LysR family transcriptional regulator [Polymorphobacter arshaanensis]